MESEGVVWAETGEQANNFLGPFSLVYIFIMFPSFASAEEVVVQMVSAR